MNTWGTWIGWMSLVSGCGPTTLVLDSVPVQETGEGDTDTPTDARVAWITEVVSANKNSLEDEQGETPDWIEIYNPGPESLSLIHI